MTPASTKIRPLWLVFCGMALASLLGFAEAWAQIDVAPIDLAPRSADPTAGLGTLDPDAGGLPVDLWRGSDPALIALLLEAQAPTGIPALDGLLRQALLSTAFPPETSGTPQASPPVPGGFLAARATALAQLGRPDEAADLVLLAGDQSLTPTLSTALAEARLRAGRDLDACSITPPSQAPEDLPPFWRRLDVLCQIEAGNAAGAGFVINLLVADGIADQDFAAFATSARVASEGRSTTPAELPAPAVGDWVGYRLALRAGAVPDARWPAPLVDAALNTLPPATLASLPAGVLIERGRQGRISPQRLAELLAERPFAAAALADPLTAAAELGDEEAALLLLAASQSETLDPARAVLLAEAWTRAQPVSGSLTAIFADAFDRLAPGPGTRAAREAAIAAYTLGGAASGAASWRRLAPVTPEGEARATALRTALWPLGEIRESVAMPDFETGWTAWRQWHRSTIGSGQAGDTAIVAASLYGAGTIGEADLANTLLADTVLASDAPASAVFGALFAASRIPLAVAGGRTGEALLWSALALQGASSGAAPPAALAAGIEGLRALGYDAAAREAAAVAAGRVIGPLTVLGRQ